MRGAGGPVTLNIQSFSEKSTHPFIHLDENLPSFRVKTDSLYQARTLQKPLRHSPYMVLRVRCLNPGSGALSMAAESALVESAAGVSACAKPVNAANSTSTNIFLNVAIFRKYILIKYTN